MTDLNVIEAEPGEHISRTVERAKRQLAHVGMSFGYVKFNGLTIPFNVDSNVSDVCIIYNLKCELERYQQGWK